MKILDKKTLRLRFLEYAGCHVFRLSKITVCLGCFWYFLTKERSILAALKKMIWDEIKQSNSMKPQKSTFSWFFVSFFLTKKISVGKCIQKLFIPSTFNFKNISSVHQSSTIYLKLSLKTHGVSNTKKKQITKTEIP